MARALFLTCFLLGSVEVLAQADVRAYYNKFEWVGVAGGYSVSRWRYELGGSWHQQELVGLYESGHPDSVINGYIAYPVFEDDVWSQTTTTMTGRILRSGKKARPAFGLYYGLYLRYVLQKSELTEPNWSYMEEDFANRYKAATSDRYAKIGAGLVLGAQGTFAGSLFWDLNISILPFIHGNRKVYYTDGSVDSQQWSAVTYLEEDTAHILQVGIGYKFGPKKE